jgi:hypothetical protein
MRLEIVNFCKNNCHKYGSQILYRAIRFAKKYDATCDPETLWHTITIEMAKQSAEMLVLAAVENGKVVGHLLCRIINNDGTLICLITQLEIDEKKRDNREEVMIEGMEIIEQFAEAWKCKRIRCWARDEKVAKLFERFGFEPKDYVLMDIGLEVEDG